MSQPIQSLPTDLVGRELELKTIGDALSALGKGHGRCLFITGEPGIGKSSLCRSLAATAQDQQLPVHWGFAWETGGAPAYWPWTQALRSMLERHAEPLDAALSGPLVEILPELAEAGSAPLTLQPEQARFRLLEGARSLLDRLSRESAQIIILEDLHGADGASLHLLDYLSRHVQHMPVLLVGSFREMEARTSNVTAPLWQAVRNADVLRPTRLNSEQVRHFLESQPDQWTPESVAELYRVTEGNPLFLSELVSLLSATADSPRRLPETIHQVIAQQVGRLPAATAALLAPAAVLGRQFLIDELEQLLEQPAINIHKALQPAEAAGILQRLEGDEERFFHGLCCEVLLQQLDPAQRESLHWKSANLIRAQIEQGSVQRTTELANHLSRAGTAHRQEAVQAWRDTARQATERLAFEEAVQALDRALATYGDGPRFSPSGRCELILELAAANLLKGDISTGQQQCMEAYRFARTVKDPVLMAQAALTYGSVIVVAKVDADLVSALEETLDLLAENDSAMRARVTARLAGALQPAPKPAIPMQMARDAILLARTTQDESVIYEVLRSAVSAIMDFAPAAERIALNQEFGELAARRGDVPGLFRTALRLIIDAIEIADRDLLLFQIRQCEQMAGRIQLPHYQWRVASVQALLATIEGDFARAVDLLADAETMASAIADETALMTIPIQRLMIMQDWAEDTDLSIEQITRDLEAAFLAFPDAEIYVRPLLASYMEDAAIAPLLDNDELIERLISGGDRFTICRVAELAARSGRTAVAKLAYQTLQPFDDQCASLGLMGSGWGGPVAWTLGTVATFLKDYPAAERYYERALQICEDMHAGPVSARIRQHQAALALFRGDQDSVAGLEREASSLLQRFNLKRERKMPVSGEVAGQSQESSGRITSEKTASTGPLTMQRDGDVWRIDFQGIQTTLKSSRGLELLARLIDRPDQEIHALDLSDPARTEPVDSGGSGPGLDEQARAEYQSRINELNEQLEDAESLGDLARADAAREEIEFISREISRAFGLGGRNRSTGSAAERARVNVQRRLRDAISRIEQQLPDAGRYLNNTIKTGTYCQYRPF